MAAGDQLCNKPNTRGGTRLEVRSLQHLLWYHPEYSSNGFIHPARTAFCLDFASKPCPGVNLPVFSSSTCGSRNHGTYSSSNCKLRQQLLCERIALPRNRRCRFNPYRLNHIETAAPSDVELHANPAGSQLQSVQGVQQRGISHEPTPVASLANTCRSESSAKR